MDNTSGTSVQMNTSNLINILENMYSIVKNMNEEIYGIYEIKERVDKNWNGKASVTFAQQFDAINKKMQDGNIKKMYQRLIDATSLIEENKRLSQELTETEFEFINKIKEELNNTIINSVEVNGVTKPETGTITSDINANNGIGSTEAIVDDFSSDLFDNVDNVKMDTTISSNSVSLDDMKKTVTDNYNEIVNGTNTSTSSQAVSSNTTEEKSNLGTAFGASAMGDVINKGGV